MMRLFTTIFLLFFGLQTYAAETPYRDAFITHGLSLTVSKISSGIYPDGFFGWGKLSFAVRIYFSTNKDINKRFLVSELSLGEFEAEEVRTINKVLNITPKMVSTVIKENLMHLSEGDDIAVWVQFEEVDALTSNDVISEFSGGVLLDHLYPVETISFSDFNFKSGSFSPEFIFTLEVGNKKEL